MKTRIMTAAVAIPVLLLVLLVANKIIAAIVWAALMAVAAYELLYSTGLIKESRLVIYSCVMAFALCTRVPSIRTAENNIVGIKIIVKNMVIAPFRFPRLNIFINIPYPYLPITVIVILFSDCQSHP